MRLLLCESWRFPVYAEPFLQRFRELGESVWSFREESFFRPRANLGSPWQKLSSLSCHLQERFRYGPRVDRLNAVLLQVVRRIRPDVVVVFRSEQIFPETIGSIQSMGIVCAAYNNDDPFGRTHPKYRWRHFLGSVQRFDHVFAYRKKNIEDLRWAGAKRATLLRSFYIRERNFPIADTPKDLDVSFIGHWENDCRTDYVAAILRNPGTRFGLWGHDWLKSPLANQLRFRFGAIHSLGGREYNLAINRTRISLVFLSGLNNDTYTRRCFEIPAAGGFMLAPYNEDLASLFQEGEEAEYFRSPDEMLDKINFYLKHENARAGVAAAGHQRVLRDGHEAIDRARQMRNDLLDLMTPRIGHAL